MRNEYVQKTTKAKTFLLFLEFICGNVCCVKMSQTSSTFLGQPIQIFFSTFELWHCAMTVFLNLFLSIVNTKRVLKNIRIKETGKFKYFYRKSKFTLKKTVMLKRKRNKENYSLNKVKGMYSTFYFYSIEQLLLDNKTKAIFMPILSLQKPSGKELAAKMYKNSSRH